MDDGRCELNRRPAGPPDIPGDATNTRRRLAKRFLPRRQILTHPRAFRCAAELPARRKIAGYAKSFRPANPGVRPPAFWSYQKLP